jgi:DegV family protein with EDD domain
MAASKVLPKTSQPSPGDFKTVFERLLADDPGAAIVCVLVSGGVSGTVESAHQAAAMLPGAAIHVFDTRSVSLGQGLMAVRAAQMACQGAGLDAILGALGTLRDRTQVVFAVKTLDNLAKGGRIGRASFLLASALEIKPLLTMRDGVLDAHSRHRTWGRALGALRDLVIEDVLAARAQASRTLYLGVAHADNDSEARSLADALADALHPDVALFSEISLGLGVHSGVGALGACWAVLPD